MRTLVVGLVAMNLAGCGVSALAMRIADVGYGEHVGSTRPVHLDRAPAHHAIVRWQGVQLSCGRVTDLETTTDHYAWTTMTKVLMGFFATAEAISGTALLVSDGTKGSNIAGGIMLGDAALAVAQIFLFGQRHYVTKTRGFGLAYGCHPGDGIVIGAHVAPVSADGHLAEEHRQAVLDELAAGKPLRIVVDRKPIAVPVEPAERCAALGLERRDASCTDTQAPSVLVTLGRAPSVVRLPLLPLPPPPPPPTGAPATGAP